MSEGFALLARPTVSLCGEGAVLLDAEGPLSLETQERIWNLADRVVGWRGVADVQPGINNLLVVADPRVLDPEALRGRVSSAWPNSPTGRAPGRTFAFDVIYGGEHAGDLHELAAIHGLDASDVARLHSEGEYVVFAPGVAPGFGYLFGLDPRLFTPRRPAPLMRDLDSYVGIGGAQAGLGNPRPAGRAPTTTPTGWYVIGKALDLPAPFDWRQYPPSLVSLGDRIRFRLSEVRA